jgi:signal transduction histidine kinase
MKLQGKFTAVFAVAALTPIVGAFLLVRLFAHNTYDHAAARILDEARRSGEAQFRTLAGTVESAAAALADPNDRDLHELLVALARGEFDEDRQRELADRAPLEMRARGLDTLEILDLDGHVLACGHVRARVGETDPDALARARAHPGQPLLAEERVLADGQLRPALAVEAARISRPLSGKSVVVVAGRLLDYHFLEGLHQHGRLEARLTRPGGSEVVAALDEPWREFSWRPASTLALAGADRVVRAWLQLSVTDADLRSLLEGAKQAASLVAGGALMLALLLGAFVARRITQPVRELARGADAIAHGQLDVRLEHKPRQDELWDLVQSFNRMAEDLLRSKEQLVQTERVAAWREIARRLAHEIKNPLTPIQTSIETMRRTRERPAEFPEHFERGTQIVLAEVARLKKIVQEFSDFARLPKPELQPCDLAQVARDALALYEGAQVPVRAELPEAPLSPVLADRQQLQQVLLNLLENARDAVAKKTGGAIVVRVRALDGAIELEVEDNGVGLSAAVRERLFTPYFTTKSSGTGLGLAIVHRIVTDHGGRVSVRSAEGAGATFTITLPLHAAEPAAPAQVA